MGSKNDDFGLSFHDEAVKYYADDIARICANVRKVTGSNLKADIGDYVDEGVRRSIQDYAPGFRTEDDDGIRFSFKNEPETEKAEVVSDYYSWEKKNASYSSFSGKFNDLFAEKKLSSDEFFLRSHIDRKLLSKIRTDYTYHPSKLTVIRACVGLELGLDDSLDLLEAAGYTLSSSSSFDLAIRYCLIRELSDIEFINDILKELDEEIML